MPAPTFQAPVSESDWTAEPGLFEIYRDYAAAQTNHDQGFFERVEANDFRLFNADGKTLSRSEDIQWLNDSPTGIVYTRDDLNVEVHGNAAIVTGRMTATYNGGYSVSWRWIDVCLKRGGRWQIQSTTEVG
jgi:ketosteroid isomerase-like protein